MFVSNYDYHSHSSARFRAEDLQKKEQKKEEQKKEEQKKDGGRRVDIRVTQRRTRVVGVLKAWMGEYPNDFLEVMIDFIVFLYFIFYIFYFICVVGVLKAWMKEYPNDFLEVIMGYTKKNMKKTCIDFVFYILYLLFYYY